MRKYMKRPFTKGDIQMVRKYMKRYSTSLAVKDTQIKTTRTAYYPPISRVLSLQNSHCFLVLTGCGDTGSHTLLVGM